MFKYSSEKNVQMLISLMKQHEIKKIVVSPGMKNLPFIASVQFDPYFEVYSCVDERSAAYIACGLAVESNEPVVLSCTGATASRNYISALTEAFYRHIPILAVTSMSYLGEIGHLVPQVIDRSVPLKDIVIDAEEINPIHNEKEAWDVNIRINRALLALRHHEGGPVHINLVCENFTDFEDKLEQAKMIRRYCYEDSLPEINEKNVAIFIGAHRKFDDEFTQYIDKFCEKYNGVVLCDNTSNYYGKYRIQPSVLNTQAARKSGLFNVNLLIHIGDISGAYYFLKPKKVWRVNPDGALRDTYKALTATFEMTEKYFFKNYFSDVAQQNTSYYENWKAECKTVEFDRTVLPYSNAWIAGVIEENLPENSVIHLGILNSLRNWDFYSLNSKIYGYSNTGGFGIDGIISTAVGAALAKPDQITYVVLGDLAFFYDINVLGNRHVPNNLRIILVNNGRGIEFRNYKHPSARFGEEADPYMAAAGHFGSQSPELVKNFVSDLGFEYHAAASKEQFNEVAEIILNPVITDRPILVEAFTTTADESKALELISNILEKEPENKMKSLAKDILGESGVKTLKKIIKGDKN